MTVANNIRNQEDVFAKPIGHTLNKDGLTTAYQFYSGTLNSGNTPLTIDVATDLGSDACKICIINTSVITTTSFTVAFTIDGTTYGDEITVLSGYPLNFDNWIKFKKVRLTRVSADSTYWITVI